MTHAATINTPNYFVCHFFHSTMFIIDQRPSRLDLETRLQTYLEAAEIYYGNLHDYTIIYRGIGGQFQHVIRRLSRVIGLYDLKAKGVEEAAQESRRSNIAVIG